MSVTPIPPPTNPATRPATRTGHTRKQLWIALAIIAVTLMTLALTVWASGRSTDPDRLSRRDSTVWIAQITDPHLFEELKSDPAKLTAAEQENQRAFAQALRFIGTGMYTGGRPPDALVITGDFGLDSTFLAKPRPDALTGRGQVRRMVDLLRQSAVSRVFVVIGNNDLTEEKPQATRLAYFHQLIREAADSLRPQVNLADLTECYGDPRGTCTADLGGNVRLVGFATASFKNAPVQVVAPTDPAVRFSDSARATTDTMNVAWERGAVRRLDQLLTQAEAERRNTIVLTHEPDIDDPYSAGLVRSYKTANPNDRTGFTPLIWNVERGVQLGWENAINRRSVIAVIAGHLHSSDRRDYQAPYPNTGVTGNRLYVGPPLAVKNQEAACVQARGVSFFRVQGQNVFRQVVWRDPQAGFPEVPATGGSPGGGKPGGGGRPPSGLSTGEAFGIVLLAMLAAAAAAVAAFSERQQRWAADGDTWWPQRLRVLSVMLYGVVGLLCAILLFTREWNDRAAVAVPYLAAFTVTLAASLAVLRIFERERDVK